MPIPTSGFSGNEIVQRVIRFVGNTSAEFKSYVENTLPLVEYRFCKMHDWKFLHKHNLSLAVSGTPEYQLTIGTIGFDMGSEDIESIFCPESGGYLRRMDLNQIRRLDPGSDDGNVDGYPTHWTTIDDKSILIYPPVFKPTTLKIDGKITPSPLLTLTQYPTIPYKYQESFIEYIIALSLDRENDDRGPSKKDHAFALIREDIKDDLRQLSNTLNPRLKSSNEQNGDGNGGSLESILYFWNDWD